MGGVARHASKRFLIQSCRSCRLAANQDQISHYRLLFNPIEKGSESFFVGGSVQITSLLSPGLFLGIYFKHFISQQNLVQDYSFCPSSILSPFFFLGDSVTCPFFLQHHVSSPFFFQGTLFQTFLSVTSSVPCSFLWQATPFSAFLSVTSSVSNPLFLQQIHFQAFSFFHITCFNRLHFVVPSVSINFFT